MSTLDKVVRTEERTLLCTHEEVDSRIFFHVSCLDTDCLIIGLGSHKKLDLSLKIWLEVGVQSRNNLRFISADSIYSYLWCVARFLTILKI